MAIFVFIVGIIVLIVLHELGHFFAAKLFNIRVEEFGFGFPPRLFKKRIGETEYTINALPFGGFVRLYGEHPDSDSEQQEGADISRAYYTQKLWKRFSVVVAGVLINFVLGWIILASVFAVGAPKSILVAEVIPNTPAELAGLTRGDRILSFEDADEFISFINDGKGQEVSFPVVGALSEEEEISKNNTRDVIVVPRENPPEGEGSLGIVVSDIGIERRPLGTAIWESLKTSFIAIGLIFRALFEFFVSLFQGGAEVASDGFVGPVGIFELAEQTGSIGMIYLFELIALISLNLAALNILPIPALDGGRVLFMFIEKVRGKPVQYRKESYAHAIGFILLLLLMILITAKDIANIF